VTVTFIPVTFMLTFMMIVVTVIFIPVTFMLW